MICILSRERRMLQIGLREEKMLTLNPWLSRAPSTRRSGCTLSARSPGGTSLTGSICSTRGCDHGPGGSIVCPPRKNHTQLPWGQGGNPCNTHPTVGCGGESKNTLLKEDGGWKETFVDLPGGARAQGKAEKGTRKLRSKTERKGGPWAYHGCHPTPRLGQDLQ